MGTFAVPIAQWLGASVTAVTRTDSVDLVRSIGGDEVIDYRMDDFTRRRERYDGPVIDRRYTRRDAPEAIGPVGTGQARGKVVIPIR